MRWVWMSLLVLVACGGEDAPQGEIEAHDAGNDAQEDPRADIAEDVAGDTEDTAEDVAEDATDAGGEDVDPGPRVEAWHEGAVFYEVFVRSFQDSNGDGIGDLRGLIQRMDYLNDGRPGEGDDLEVDGLWLMPIFKSPSYHGYDTLDYETIDPLYGTQADLVELLELCHARGVRVILDLVLNHTSSRHPWFLNASRSADNPYRDFYVWRADNPGWTRPWGNQPVWHRSGEAYYYGIFWEGMPDLNYRNPAVEEEMLRVAAHWVELGVDGYRVDAARYLVEDEQGGQSDLPETHAFFRRLRAHLAPSRDVTLVAEAWTEREAVLGYYGDGDEFHAAFDFDLAQNIERSISVGQASFLRTELGRIQRSGRWEFEATFLSNHDMDRLARRLRRAGAVDAAWGVLLTLPGTPFLYYGDELGMASGSGGGDEAKRTPMAWTPGDYAGFSRNEPWYALSEGYQARNVETLLADPQSTLRRVQALLRLRKQHAALRTGGALALLTSPDPALYAALRWKDGERFLVAVNLSSQPLDPSALDLTQAGATPSDALEGVTSARPVLGDGEVAPLADPAAFSLGASLAPGEARVWSLE